MKKVISFSLYGNQAIYLEGMLANIHLAHQLFPNFICRIYIDDTIPTAYIQKLSAAHNVELINMSGSPLPKMTWRFLCADDEDVELFFSYDADSRLSEREQSILHDWMNRPEKFLIIKDHPVYHTQPLMMGGMWGMKKGTGIDMYQTIVDWCNCKNIKDSEKYNIDQQFLADCIYPLALQSVAYYDDYNINQLANVLPIPHKRKGYRFVGEAFNADGSLRPEYKALRTYIWSNKNIFCKYAIKYWNWFDRNIINRNKVHFIVR